MLIDIVVEYHHHIRMNISREILLAEVVHLKMTVMCTWALACFESTNRFVQSACHQLQLIHVSATGNMFTST